MKIKSPNPTVSTRLMTKAALCSIAVMLLTTVHHAYGAVVDNSPFRFHVVLISVLVMLIILGTLGAFRKWTGSAAGEVALWLFIIVATAVPVVWIGFMRAATITSAGIYSISPALRLVYTGNLAMPSLKLRVFITAILCRPNCRRAKTEFCVQLLPFLTIQLC